MAHASQQKHGGMFNWRASAWPLPAHCTKPASQDMTILKRKKISFFDAETTTRPLSLLERSTTGRPVAPDAQNRY